MTHATCLAALSDDSADRAVVDDAGAQDFAGRPRVLVVEDDPATAELYAFLLEAVGYDVRAIDDGERALGAARAYRPTVIVSDIDLPGRDGFALAAALRSDPSFGHTPMVAVSGRLDGDCDAQARRAGFARFLPKPVPPGALSRALAEVLDRRRRQDRLHGPDRRRPQAAPFSPPASFA